jgi:hypothetical protein
MTVSKELDASAKTRENLGEPARRFQGLITLLRQAPLQATSCTYGRQQRCFSNPPAEVERWHQEPYGIAWFEPYVKAALSTIQ